MAGNDKEGLRITLHGRKDRHGEDYYLSTPNIPVLVDLSRSVLLFFPAEEQDELDGTSMRDHFRGELVIKLRKTRDELEAERPKDGNGTPRRTRRSRPEAAEDGVE